MDSIYLIGLVSKKTGFSIHTLRFYEKQKLICPERDSRGRRFYSERDLERLAIIKNFKVIGTSLEDIKRYFYLFEGAEKGKAQRRAFLLLEKEKIDAQIRHLKEIEAFIDHILVHCGLVDERAGRSS